MTPEQFRRLSFALILFLDDVPLDEALREGLERAKLAPEDVWSEDGLIDNVKAALQLATQTRSDEKQLRASILSGALKFADWRRTRPMRDQRRTDRENRTERAQQLRKEGSSVAQIAIRMTDEENEVRQQKGKPPRAVAITPRAVERWLETKKLPTV